MDIIPLAGMLFSLLVVLIIAGSILMFPVMRQLGRLLGQRLDERESAGLAEGEARALLETLEGIQAQVARLAERQAFTERLLEEGAAGREGAGEPGSGGRPPGPGSSGMAPS